MTLLKTLCKSIGCNHHAVSGQDFCGPCLNTDSAVENPLRAPLSEVFPDTYKSTGDMADIDAFAVNHLFGVNDNSGCLQHAVRKLLHSGTAEHVYRDIREARDALTRWLQLNAELNVV